MSDSKLCKIIDPKSIIQTPCGKFLIGIESNSIFSYCLETKQKFRIAGCVNTRGHQDGTRNESRFNYPKGLTLSKDLKTLFISDRLNNVIRVVCVGTGITTTFAGKVNKFKQVDGSKEKACFYLPSTLKLSPDGKTLIVSDNSKLRTICITTGQVDTIDIFDTFDTYIVDFALSPDGKHVIICHLNKVLKYNLETGKSEIILEDEGFDNFIGCELSKDGQLLFIVNEYKHIQIVNIVTNKIIEIINLPFKPSKLKISTNAKQLYVIDYENDKIQVLDISNYYTNFKTFLQLQLSKHSFLSRLVVNRFN
jgi:DNA-binding beta-propeller fold protein YncE